MEIFSSAGIKSLSIPLALFHISSRELPESLIGIGGPTSKKYPISLHRQSCFHDIYDNPDIPKP